MGREHLLDESNWLLLSRRRRLRIGDLMVAVAIAAVALSVGSLSNLTSGTRLGSGVLALVFLGLQVGHWGIASISARPGPAGNQRVPLHSLFLIGALDVRLLDHPWTHLPRGTRPGRRHDDRAGDLSDHLGLR